MGYGGTFPAQWKEIKEYLHDKIGNDLIERIKTRIEGWKKHITHAKQKVFLTEEMLRRRISSNLLEPMLVELYDLIDILNYRPVEEQERALNIWKEVYGFIEQYIDRFRIGMELENAIALLELIEDNLRMLDYVVSQ